jgi:hypothetical protein
LALFNRVVIILAILMAASLMISCGDTTVQAQQQMPASILSGHCGVSNGNVAYMVGLGATSDTCNSSTGSDMTGLPMPSTGMLKNLQVLSLSHGAVVKVFVNGTATTITCTVPSNANVCSDLSNTTGIVAGDLVSVQVTTTDSFVQFTQVALEKQ